MPAALDPVSRREAEVLAAVGEHLTNAEIAHRLHISVRTVESHVSSLLRKLGAADRRQLATLAISRSGPSRRPKSVDLPAPTTRFVGRDAELALLERLLREHRLVTITGAGGIGKTRLAIEAAGMLADSYPDGVMFLDLATVPPEAPVGEAMATTLAVTAQPGETATEAVARYLAPRAGLVLLDNCEHLVGDVARLVALIISGRGQATILATSREPLRLGDERVLALSQLPVPEPGEPAESVDDCASVRLFTDRAAALDSEFRLTSDNRALIAEICARLDGIPLALELASTRVAQLPLTRLAAELRDCTAILDQGPRDLPGRQQTLRATIDWSYELLDEPERLAFERLAVLAGPFSLEAAESVCGFAPLRPDQVLPVFTRLVTKSLVTRAHHRGGDADYRLLEPIRQYALARLEGRGEADAARAAHAEYFVALAEKPELGVRSSGSADDHDRLRRGQTNFRAALAWAFDHRDPSVRELGIRLVSALAYAWFVSGAIDEGWAWTERALAATAGTVTPLRGRVLFAQAALGTTRADWDAVVRATAEMMQIADALDDKLLPAFALEIRGVASWGQGDLGDADISFAEATKVASQAGLAWQESFTRAEHARLLADRGELSRADELADRALAVAIAAGEDMPRGFALDVLAVQARNRGDVAAATALAVESLACYEAVGYQEGVASALQLLALTDLERGDLASAQHRLTQVFDLHRRLGHRAGVVSALEASARLHALQGDDMRAASLLWTADRLRDEIGVPRPVPEHDSAERLRQEITARLGTRADAARRNGLTLDLDAAVLLAAGVSVPPGSSREQNS